MKVETNYQLTRRSALLALGMGIGAFSIGTNLAIFGARIIKAAGKVLVQG